jgi:translation initiation factor 2D
MACLPSNTRVTRGFLEYVAFKQFLRIDFLFNRVQVAYLSPDGVPLWFTTGKGSDRLVPTRNWVPVFRVCLVHSLASVYTLWKHEDLLPFLSTPSAVIPVLINGADLMAPGGLAFLP